MEKHLLPGKTIPPTIDQAPAAAEDRLPDAQRGRHSPTLGNTDAKGPPANSQTPGRLLIVLVVIIMLVNVPLNLKGTGAARLAGQTERIILRDGLLLKGRGPQIYLLQDHQLRPFSSQQTFDYFFRRYQTSEQYDFMQVQTVDELTLNKLGRGRPIYRLVRCIQTRTIYALDGVIKYPVDDPPPSTSAPWDRVEQVSCVYLDSLTPGPPISFD